MRRTPRPKEFEGLFDPAEEISGESLVWPPATRYTIFRGEIRPEPGSRWLRHFPPAAPFSKTNLFHSFAKLGAYGEPSNEQIRAWVERNGLLTRNNERLSGSAVLEDGTVNQRPIGLAAFKSEVSRAHALLQLYAELREANVAALSARIKQPRSTVDEEMAAYFSGDSLNPAKFWEVYASLVSTIPVLSVADKVLSRALDRAITGVRLRTIQGFDIPPHATDNELPSFELAAIKNYRLRQGWHCPDLLSAMYLQFYLLVTQNRPMRRCENPPCPMTFPATRSNKRFCDDACRSNARHYR